MIQSLAISNYRSFRSVVTSMGNLNIVTGPNGSGKSNLYKALRLLADASNGNMIHALAQEGGLKSVFWAGPESLSRRMRTGDVPVEGTGARRKPMRLKLGFGTPDLGYSVSLGIPAPDKTTMFSLDPEIKRECIWAGPAYHPNGCLIDRNGPAVRIRSGSGWECSPVQLNTYESILNELSDPVATPEVHAVCATIRDWRFYDHFRTDRESKIRMPQVGTRTLVLDHDGHSLVAALRTIYEIGDRDALADTINDAFPGASIDFTVDDTARVNLQFNQHGLLRSLNQSELSDGTLRYLLLIAALLTPRPPALMVLNEPETSLHPDLIPALGRLITRASAETQVWVITHDPELVKALESSNDSCSICLAKELGETQVVGQRLLDQPSWHWPDK